MWFNLKTVLGPRHTDEDKKNLIELAIKAQQTLTTCCTQPFLCELEEWLWNQNLISGCCFWKNITDVPEVWELAKRYNWTCGDERRDPPTVLKFAEVIRRTYTICCLQQQRMPRLQRDLRCWLRQQDTQERLAAAADALLLLSHVHLYCS